MLRTFAAWCVALVVSLPVTALAQKASAPAKETAATAPAPVNLNTATAAQLEALPGIGAKTAQLIIQYREKNGPFKKIEDLMNVKGIGEKSFLKLKPRLIVTAPAATSN